MAFPPLFGALGKARLAAEARSQREALTLGKALDLLAEGKPGAAADILAQRLKAVEKAAREGGRWDQAEFLELIPPAGPSLAERSEEFMAAKEVRLAVRAGLRAPPGNFFKGSDKGGKGQNKGKEKGQGKGPPAAPAEMAAPTADGAGARRNRRQRQ